MRVIEDPTANSMSHALVPLTVIDFASAGPCSLAFALWPTSVEVTHVNISIRIYLHSFSMPTILQPETFIPSLILRVDHDSKAMPHLFTIKAAGLSSIKGVTKPDKLCLTLTNSEAL